MLRLSKLFMVVSIATFFSITVLNNIQDYNQTFNFIFHTLSMDTTSHNSHFMWRAITNPLIQHVLFMTIILVQSVIALLNWIGAAQMTYHLNAEMKTFRDSKKMAILGSALGFTLYALVFLIIAGQWFMMRESTSWNVQNSVHTFLSFLGIGLIYLNMLEE